MTSDDEEFREWTAKVKARMGEILHLLNDSQQPEVELAALYTAAIAIHVKSSRKISDFDADRIRDELGLGVLGLKVWKFVAGEIRDFLKQDVRRN